MGPTAQMTLGAVGTGLASLATLVVVLRSVRARRSPRLGASDLLLPVGALAVGFGATVAVGVVSGDLASPWFAFVHVAYLTAVVSGPLLGLGVAVAGVLRRADGVAVVVALVLLVPAPTGWYATHWAPYALRVDRASLVLPTVRAGRQPLLVGVLSDLQTNRIGGYERRAVSTLLAERPDLIVVTGDLFQGDERQFQAALPAMRQEVARLRAPGGVFAVRGDTDTGSRLDRIVAGTDVEILDYEVVHRRVGDRRVAIGGNELLWAPAPAVAVRKELMASAPAEVRILVSHRPDVVLLLPSSSGVDLVVAGHTHGGQVALPLLGPIETFSRISRRVGAGGLHRVEGNPIYVSTGVGLVREQAPQVRFLTRPSVGLVTLR